MLDPALRSISSVRILRLSLGHHGRNNGQQLIAHHLSGTSPSSSSSPSSHPTRPFSTSILTFSSSSSSSSSIKDDETSEDDESQSILRAWSTSLDTRRSEWRKKGGTKGSLSKEVFDVTFSRASGPGGQNVNKVNTKANVRLLLAQASSPGIFDPGTSPLPVPIPREVVKRLVVRSSYYTQANHSLLVSSDSLRTQEGNLNTAIEKLLDHLHQHATSGLINPTSAEQKTKVQRLIEREKRKLKKVKTFRSAVKSGRRDKGGF